MTEHTAAIERFEAVVAKWKATWEELVPSTSAAVKLNLQELVEMVCFALQSQSWAVKKQGAAAIATIADTMGQCMYMCACVCVCVCMCVCMKPWHVCTCVHMYVCVCIL